MFMKKIFFLLILLAFAITCRAQQKYEIDFSNPENVVNAIFYAANTKDYAVLLCITDPFDESDVDIKRLREVPKLAELIKGVSTKEMIDLVKDFIITFSNGKITGPAIFETHENDLYAEIPVLISTPIGEQISEKITLIERYGNWYLLSF